MQRKPKISPDNLFMAANGVLFVVSQLKKRKKTETRFWARSELQLCNEHELLVSFQKYDIGLSGELRSSLQNLLRMSSEDFEHLLCRVGPAVKHTRTPN